MIVELYGLPAVGKTTYARLCTSATHVKLSSRSEKFRWFCAFLIHHPFKALMQAYTLACNSPSIKLFAMKCINIFFVRNALMMKAQSMEASCILLDEGPLQSILSIFEVPLTKEQAKRYLQALILPDALIILDVSTEERKKRLNRRRQGIRDSLGEEYKASWDRIFIHNHNVIQGLLNDIPLKYVIVNNSQSSTTRHNTSIDPCTHF